MLIAADDLPRDEAVEADVAVVGAGAAGITLARVLAALGHEVVLLESGDFDLDGRTQALYRGDVIGHRYPDLDVTRLRQVGGTTNHWHGWCRPLDPIDLERRDWVPLSGWPISHDDLARWYLDAHEVVQLGPTAWDGETWRDMIGVDVPTTDDRLDASVFQFSPPTRFGERYRDELVGSRRIRLVTGANVTHVQASPEGRRVDSLRVQTLAGNAFDVTARVHVLAAGSLEVVRLLLVSDDVHVTGLGNQNDLVGRCFTEHPHVRVPVVAELPAEERRWFDRHVVEGARVDGSDLEVLGVLALSDAARRDHQLLGWTAELWDASDDEPDGVEVLLHGLRHAEDADLTAPDPARTHVTLRMEQVPNQESRVTLTDDVDELGLRRIALDWRFTRQDHESLEASLGLLASWLGSRGVGTVAVRQPGGQSWLDNAQPGNHQLGVARMAADPSRGVVDADCRVHGVGNLYLSGGCVFPTVGHANPTLTVVAMALRLGDHLRRELA